MSAASGRLARRVRTAEELQTLVRVMKAYASAAAGPHMRAAEAIAAYREALEQGLSICLRQAPNLAEAWVGRGAGGTTAIAFGSDHGLVGPFNDVLASFLAERLAALGGPSAVWVAGERLTAALRGTPLTLRPARAMPGTVGGIVPLVADLLLAIEHSADWPVGRLVVFHHRPLGPAHYEPRLVQLVPLEPAWLAGLRRRPWPTRQRPEAPTGAGATFEALLREHLFTALCEACADSLASEHASRLAAMLRAEHNVRDQVDALRLAYHYARQEAISDELADIVAATGGASGHRQPGDLGSSCPPAERPGPLNGCCHRGPSRRTMAWQSQR